MKWIEGGAPMSMTCTFFASFLTNKAAALWLSYPLFRLEADILSRQRHNLNLEEMMSYRLEKGQRIGETVFVFPSKLLLAFALCFKSQWSLKNPPQGRVGKHSLHAIIYSIILSARGETIYLLRCFSWECWSLICMANDCL